MSHKPIAALSGLSFISGAYAYTRYGSVPSLIASFGIGGLMSLSSMRIRDGMDYGMEGAVAMLVPTARRAITTRAPIPSVMAVLAVANTGYYTKEILDQRALTY